MNSEQQLAMQRCVAEIGRNFNHMIEQYRLAFQRWIESPDGQYVLRLVRYFDEHPEQLDAMIRARKVEAARPLCSCLCQRWGHLGSCQTYATTERTVGSVGPVMVRVCGPCADGIDAHQLQELP